MKKKLLALTFTLILLIGLVAAVGMNASAATTYTARNRLSYVNTADNLWNYVAQSYTGDVIALSGNITYDDKNDADPYILPFGAQGDMVLDLNGYTLDITTRADALVELDYGTTRLHIVNSRPGVPAKIIMRTKVGNSSMIDISKKECGVYVYEGVELVMGKEGDTAEAYKQTSVISATKFSDIAVYGGNLTNNIANGVGIVLESDNSVQFDNSTVTLHGGAKVTSKTSSIFLNDAYDYPTFNIGDAYLECNGEYYAAISNYIPASSASSQVKALTFANIVANGYSAYQTEGGGRLESRIIASSTKLLDYNTKGGLTFKLTGFSAVCNHNESTTLLNSFFGHYDVCTKCYKLRDASGEAKIVTHTYKEATSATCTADGHTPGYDCNCGYKTATTIYSPKTITLSKTEYTYNGETKKPTVTVKDTEGNELKKDTDYTVSYEKGRKATGKYTVTVTFKGNYEGTKKLYFTIQPRKVANLTATQTTKSITLKWDKSTGADGYRVYKYDSDAKEYKKIADVTETTYKITGLKSATKGKYRVKAYTNDDGKIWGNASDSLETATKPSKTEITSVKSSTAGKATVKWKDVNRESKYQLYYATSKTGTYKRYDTYSANDTDATVKSLKSGKTYYFKVRSYKSTDSGKVYSSWSDVVSVKVK